MASDTGVCTRATTRPTPPTPPTPVKWGWLYNAVSSRSCLCIVFDLSLGVSCGKYLNITVLTYGDNCEVLSIQWLPLRSLVPNEQQWYSPPPPRTVDSQWKWGCSTGELETVGTCATLLPLKTYTHTCTCTVLILVSCLQSSSMSCRIHLLPLHLHELSNLLLDSSSENLSGLFHVYLNGYCDHACPPTQIFISWVSGKILYQKVPVLSGNMFETFTRLTLPNCFVPTFGPVNWQ